MFNEEKLKYDPVKIYQNAYKIRHSPINQCLQKKKKNLSQTFFKKMKIMTLD